MKKVTTLIVVLLLWPLKEISAEVYSTVKPVMKIISIESTVLFKNGKNGLMQAIDITIDNSGQAEKALLRVKSPAFPVFIINPGIISPGKEIYRLFIPDVTEKMHIEFILEASNKIQDRNKVPWIPRKHWEICMIPISHHDLGYTNPVERVWELYNDIYLDVIQFCEATNNYPEEAKFRYSVEQSSSLQHFIETADEETLGKLAKYIKEGRIEVQALFGNMISDLCSHEELIRLLYPSFRINNQFGGLIQVGSITDVTGMSWGLPSVLAGAGIKYFFAGLPDYFDWWKEKWPDLHDLWNEQAVLRAHGKPDAFYWEGPDGAKVLVYYQGSYGCWSPGSIDQVLNELPVMLNDMDKRGNPFSVMRYGGYGCGDNTKTDIIVSEIVREWNNQWAYPRLIVSTSAMFFEKLEKECQNLRTFRGDLPQTDYSAGAASSARETGINRVAHERLQSAEKFATISSILLNSDYPNKDLKDGFDNMLLYDEHTWGMWDPIGEVQDWAWNSKSGYAYKAAGLAEMILSGRRGYSGGGPKSIANSIGFDEDGQYIVVFNPLSFLRSDLVMVPDFLQKEPFDVIDDETGERVPHQVIELDDPLSPVPYAAEKYARGGFTGSDWFLDRPAKSLAFIANDVPPMGYKTYRIIQGEIARPTSSSLILTDTSLENSFYKIILNTKTGTVKSIIDKELGIELVDKNSCFQANQLISVWIRSGFQESPIVASISKGPKGPVYASLVVKTSGAGCPQVIQEIRLYEKLRRIDFSNRVLKDMIPAMEIYFAFPFNMDNPEICFEAPLSVIRPLKDQFPGSNSNHYSIQHWANVSNEKTSITFSSIDAHLVKFGGVNATAVSQAHHGVTPLNFGDPFMTEINKGYIFSNVINSNFCTNFQTTQSGDMLFRYSVTSSKGDWKDDGSRDFGWAIHNPFHAIPVKGKSNGDLPQSFSFCLLDKSNVIILALKQAENSEGIIIRLNETEGINTDLMINFPAISIKEIYETNLVEKNERLLNHTEKAVSLKIPAFGIKTLRLILCD
ncbi:MAG: hypothetical protein IH594_03005 [Bacteroidales bacterium]|nr:hypothetical protein [Bacteroidales bacterium]